MPETTSGRTPSTDPWDHPVVNPWALEAIAQRGYDDYGLGILPEPERTPEVVEHERHERRIRTEASLRAVIADAMGDEPYDPEAITFNPDPEYVALVQARAEPRQRPVEPVGRSFAAFDDDEPVSVDPEPDPVALTVAKVREQTDAVRAERKRKDRRNARDRARRAREWDERVAAGDRPRGFRPRP